MANALIDALNRALSKAGRDIAVRRRIGTTDAFVTVACRGSVRGYSPDELTGSRAQGDTKLVVSPSSFSGGSFPGAAGGTNYPRRGDQAVIDGRPRNIEAVDPIKIGNEVVRLEIHVKG